MLPVFCDRTDPPHQIPRGVCPERSEGLGMTRPAFERWAWAWVALCLALALHVVDEALNDFLSLYNPMAGRIRAALPWLPIPVFTFTGWITGLVVAIVLLLSLTPLALRGASWMRPLSYVFAAFMILNATLHTVGSLYYGRPIAGVYSSPVLLIAAIALLVAAWKAR